MSEGEEMTTETACPYCDSSVYVRLDRDLLAGGEPFRFHGEWSPDEPEAWETFTLQVHGKEAADVADITVDDLVKIVRRGVESGTIKGAEGWFCNSALAPRCTKESHADVVAMFGGHSSCQRALVIPVSDGGSET